jgi:hypothetical protein
MDIENYNLLIGRDPDVENAPEEIVLAIEQDDLPRLSSSPQYATIVVDGPQGEVVLELSGDSAVDCPTLVCRNLPANLVPLLDPIKHIWLAVIHEGEPVAEHEMIFQPKRIA